MSVEPDTSEGGGRATQTPRVSVLLATYNGRRFIDEQVDSILHQVGVQVELVVSDDLSTDGTWEYLSELARRDQRVRLLERTVPSGGAAQNFYRLLRDVDPADRELIAFSDQDDRWRPDKLARAAAVITSGRADGYSSDVVAFDAAGREHLVRKSFAQRRLDYLFESPGPGATQVLSSRLARVVRDELLGTDRVAARCDFHDWITYAICRARGWAWYIDDHPSMEYRQHESNTFGANHGAAQRRERLRLIREGWHRAQVLLVARVALEVATSDVSADVEPLVPLLLDRGWSSRRRLARHAGTMRRRRRDRWVMAVLILCGYW